MLDKYYGLPLAAVLCCFPGSFYFPKCNFQHCLCSNIWKNAFEKEGIVIDNDFVRNILKEGKVVVNAGDNGYTATIKGNSCIIEKNGDMKP